MDERQDKIEKSNEKANMFDPNREILRQKKWGWYVVFPEGDHGRVVTAYYNDTYRDHAGKDVNQNGGKGFYDIFLQFCMNKDAIKNGSLTTSQFWDLVKK